MNLFILTRINNWEKSAWEYKGKKKDAFEQPATSLPNYLNIPPLSTKCMERRVEEWRGGGTKNTVKHFQYLPHVST